MTQQQIATAAEMASSGHVNNLKSGLQKRVSYEIGCKLVALHHAAMRKQARAAAKAQKMVR